MDNSESNSVLLKSGRRISPSITGQILSLLRGIFSRKDPEKASKFVKYFLRERLNRREITELRRILSEDLEMKSLSSESTSSGTSNTPPGFLLKRIEEIRNVNIHNNS